MALVLITTSEGNEGKQRQDRAHNLVVVVKMDSIFFLYVASDLMNRYANHESDVADERFKNMFGISPFACSWLWGQLQDFKLLDNIVEPIHLLWALLFLRQYMTDRVMAAFVRRHEQTVEKYVMSVVQSLEFLYYKLVRGWHVVFVFVNLILTMLLLSDSLSTQVNLDDSHTDN